MKKEICTMWNLKLNKDSKVLSNKIITFIVLPVMGEKFTQFTLVPLIHCLALQVLFKRRKIHRKKEKLDLESIRSSPRDGFGVLGTRASC